jgi:uncharacterized protein (TIGR02118 family)
MISVAILYPDSPDARFDAAYYVEQHMPLSIRLLGDHPGYRGVSVELGVDEPGTDRRYVAMCHYRFETFADFMAAFGPHEGPLTRDIARYTDIEPVIQVNEVRIWASVPAAGGTGPGASTAANR